MVSGGALGVDGAAHEGALDGGGRTIVVLGTGIDVLYPVRHASLFARVLEHRGALISQFPVGSEPSTWSFPKRNRLIAALCDTCVVVAAGAGSGSLYTASDARELGRRVIVLVGTAGCDLLAREGAEVARSTEDVLALLGGRSAAPPAELPAPR